MKLTLTFTDESVEVLTTKLWQCTADRIAFERHFGFTFASKVDLGAVRAVAQAAGDGKMPSPDQLITMDSQIDALKAIPEEFMAFFAWRRWKAAHPEGGPDSTFDSFVDRIASMDLDGTESGAPDPTPAPALPG